MLSGDSSNKANDNTMSCYSDDMAKKTVSGDSDRLMKTQQLAMVMIWLITQ